MINSKDKISGPDIRKHAKSEISTSFFEIPKRVMDIVGATIGVALFLITYIVLFIPYCSGENKGAILFKQQRLGRDGKIFEIYKFRSMKTNASEILEKDKKTISKIHQKRI